MLQKSLRLRTIDKIALTTDNFVFSTKKQKKFFVPEALLSDSEVEAVVGEGFSGAKKDFSKLRKLRNVVISSSINFFLQFQGKNGTRQLLKSTLHQGFYLL